MITTAMMSETRARGIERNELAQAKVAGIGAGFVGDALLAICLGCWP